MDAFKKQFFFTLILSLLLGSFFGGIMGYLGGAAFSSKLSLNKLFQDQDSERITLVQEESAIISAVERVSPAVVSIIISKDLPKIERYQYRPGPPPDFFRQFGEEFEDGQPQYIQNGTEKKEVGGGSGFVVSGDGFIITNSHVVIDETADYTVLLNDEKRYPARILARDPVNDLAILKIDAKNLPTVELGDSSTLRVGQSVIAIGNSLGEFRNTVSTGVISGLSRLIIAVGFDFGAEQLSGVIQTDASINLGNSGGPLLNVSGQVIGINTAIAEQAQNVGFAIPINEAKNIINSVKTTGKFSRPWLGVRYVLLNKAIAETNKLDAEYGALVIGGAEPADPAVIPGSPAAKAGIIENDVILEIEGEKIDADNPLIKAISRFKPGEEITLKILRKGEKIDIGVKLEEMK